MKTFGWREGCALASVLILTGILYLRSGLSDAYFAADDFQWLSAGHSLGEFHNVPFPSGGGFYRPLVVIWFGGLVSLCGSDTFCYHLANLAVHLLNIALVFSIV